MTRDVAHIVAYAAIFFSATSVLLCLTFLPKLALKVWEGYCGVR